MKILVIGGSGFIGRYLIGRLVKADHRIDVPTRRLPSARELFVYPTVTVMERDIHDDAELDSLVVGMDAVINLVGILHSAPGNPYGADFARAHVELPRRIAQACVRHGVRRLLHVSALGASASGTSEYLRSKGAGEAVLTEVSAGKDDFHVTVFRPSVVFGPGDGFMNMFAGLARFFPVLPLAGTQARMQPVFVGDVAQAIMTALERSDTQGQVYELAGPKVYTLGELVGLAAEWSGHPRKVLALPLSVGRMQAWFFEHLPGEPLMSRDNLASLQTDNVLSDPAAQPVLGIVPTPLEEVAPAYLRRPVR